MTPPGIHEALESGAESIVLNFSSMAQMIKACEEMGELTTKLCKRLNGSPTSDGAIIDEIGDALIMVYQMREIFGRKDVDARVLFKLNRTLEIIRSKTNKECLHD